MNYFEHHIGDYDADTAHLSWIEDMAYTRLMRLYYRRERPIPREVPEACRLIRATSRVEKQAVEAVLREFFEVREDGWHQARCDSEIAIYQKRVEHNQRVGKLGGRPRKIRPTEEPADNPLGFNREPAGNPPQTPDPRPQEPQDSVTDVTGGAAAKSPAELTKDELWKAGKSLLSQAGLPPAQCGSFVGKLVKDYGDQIVVDAVRTAVTTRPADPVEYLKATCMHAAKQRGPINKPSAHAGLATRNYSEGVNADGTFA